MKMKAKEPFPIRLDVPCLPSNIYVSYEPFETAETEADRDVIQNRSGRNLIKEMADLFLGLKEIEIFTRKNEKPKAYSDGQEFSVSFSHTKGAVSGAMSFQYIVGCDMENINRSVDTRLLERVRHEFEHPDLYENIVPVQIWTLKESALKMIGTGLRKPMKSVCLTYINRGEFDAEFDDGKRAKICSFQHRNHWISVCYRNLTEA